MKEAKERGKPSVLEKRNREIRENLKMKDAQQREIKNVCQGSKLSKNIGFSYIRTGAYRFANNLKNVIVF